MRGAGHQTRGRRDRFACRFDLMGEVLDPSSALCPHNWIPAEPICGPVFGACVFMGVGSGPWRVAVG